MKFPYVFTLNDYYFISHIFDGREISNWLIENIGDKRNWNYTYSSTSGHIRFKDEESAIAFKLMFPELIDDKN